MAVVTWKETHINNSTYCNTSSTRHSPYFSEHRACGKLRHSRSHKTRNALAQRFTKQSLTADLSLGAQFALVVYDDKVKQRGAPCQIRWKFTTTKTRRHPENQNNVNDAIVESWQYAVIASLVPGHSFMQTWRCLWNRKCISSRNAAEGGPSHGRVVECIKSGELWTRAPKLCSRTDRQRGRPAGTPRQGFSVPDRQLDSALLFEESLSQRTAAPLSRWAYRRRRTGDRPENASWIWVVV